MSVIGEQIKKIRTEKGITQEQLAEMADISRVMIGRYETTDQLPALDTLIRIADALGVSTDYLLGRTPVQNPEQMVFGVDLAENKPTWRTDAPPEGTELLAKFALPGTEKRMIRTAYYLGGKYYFSRATLSAIDSECLGWSPIPED